MFSVAFLLAAIVVTQAPARAADNDDLDTWLEVELPLANGTAAYDATRDVVLVGVAGTVPALGNHLVELDPRTGAIGRALALVGTPESVAVSDDGTRAYVGFGERAAIAIEVDLETFTEVRRFGLGMTTLGPAYVDDIVVAPGRPDVVAVALRNLCCSPAHEGVAVFEDGIRRADVTPGHTGPSHLEFGDDPGTLYGGGSALYPMGVDDDGVRRTGSPVAFNTGSDMARDGDLLVAQNGRVLDLTTNTQIGAFGRSGALAVDTDSGQTWFLGGGELSRHDTATQSTLDRRDLVLPSARELIVTDDGLVALTASTVVLLGPAVTGAGFALPPAPSSLQRPLPTTAVPFEAADVAAGANGRFYVATTAADAQPNSIVEVDATGARLRHLFVGGGPDQLAVSDDGRVLFVGHRDANRVTEVDLGTFWIRRQVRLPDRNGHLSFTRQIAPVPQTNDRYLVELSSPDASPGHAGVALVVDGVVQPTITPTHTGPTAFVFGEDPDEAYGYNGDSSQFAFYRIGVTAGGATINSRVDRVLSGYGLQLTWADGLVYTSNGARIDPVLGVIVGRFAAYGVVAPVAGRDRTFIADDRDLHEAVSSDQSIVRTTTNLFPDDVTELAAGARALGAVDDGGGLTLVPIYGPPSAPVDLQAAPASLAVDLEWSAPVDDGGSPVTAYRIHRDGELVHETDRTTLDHTDAGLTEGAVHEYTVTAVNQHGRGMPSEPILGRTEGTDTEAPTVEFESPVSGATVGHGSPLTADFSCADAMSGVRTCTATLEHAVEDGIVVADGDPLDTSVLGVNLLTVTTTDWAYNNDDVYAWYVVADESDPTVTITSPVEGAEVVRGASLVADYACTDEPDPLGLASCVGDVADGADIDTSTVGLHSFTVVATDEWGNETTTTVDYEVTAPICFGEPATVMLALGDVPTSGDDVILGTDGADQVDADGGDDLVCSRGGDDVVVGGAGRDHVRLGPGADRASGGAGPDSLNGEDGVDRVVGGAGADWLVGGAQQDTCQGMQGHDHQRGCEIRSGIP